MWRTPNPQPLPIAPSITGTMPASQHSLRVVFAEMAVPRSISQRPARAVGEHFRLDMDHDFVADGCKLRDIARFEQPLGHPRQCNGMDEARQFSSASYA